MAELKSALTLIRRMPPASVENCVAGLLSVAPDITDDLLGNVDVPLSLETDPTKGQKFIKSDFNRDGDAYRSPFSNTYFEEGEAVEGELFPPANLRKMEVEANGIFDVYRKLYFDGSGSSNSSVYFFETDNKNGFGAAYLIHKDIDQTANMKSASWDSTHVVDAKEVSPGKFKYELVSSVLVSIVMTNNAVGKVDLSGSMSRQESSTCVVDDAHPHIANIGNLLEKTETSMRNSTEGIYIQKMREVFNGIRNPDQKKNQEWQKVQASLNAKMKQASSATR